MNTLPSALLAASAVIFDMDGLIVDSEPHWRSVEHGYFSELGVDIAPYLGHGQTMGLRVDEAVAFLARSTGLADVDERALADRIVAGMVRAITDNAELLPGVTDALDLFEERGMAVALASGSTPPVIDAVLDRFGLRDRFSVVTSAIDDALGKPHPAIFLRTAGALGVEPTRTMVLEDSLNGVIAAKAARMSVVAIPHPDDASDARYSLADLQLTSLLELRPLWEGAQRAARRGT